MQSAETVLDVSQARRPRFSAGEDLSAAVQLAVGGGSSSLFVHLMRTRRLARDYERRTVGTEAAVYWPMILLVNRRPARPHRGRA